MSRILASSYRLRSAAPSTPTGPIRWPMRRGGRIVMVPIDPQRIPSGWQSVDARVPMRLASCEETECPFWLGGWTEVATRDGNTHPRPGRFSADEAAHTFGLYGPASLPPQVIHHPPGTPCGRIHKLPSGLPPLYRVNGRPMPETAFLDALGEGAHAEAKARKEGRY